MFKTLATLIHGQNARAEDRVRDAFAIELIDQKIRESENSLRAAKGTLASLIQRQRSEEKQHAALKSRIADLTERAKEALDNDREDMAAEAARAIASMENEVTLRETTLDRLDQKVLRLRGSIESGHRRIIDLKQGAIQARAVRREQQIQCRMAASGVVSGSVEEAEELIARVLGKDDPFERSEILADINHELDGGTITDRMADAGFGAATRSTADDVLSRLKSSKK
ncbi:PspA/IM30 family protein [Yoonia sp. SS1-5]|uniref:PspA/IM30 family protein n=1 Tax=Yoonia rhodophyticola TaxID=3137370 RepID=A0AAN0MCF4_9RHOB